MLVQSRYPKTSIIMIESVYMKYMDLIFAIYQYKQI